MKCHDQHAAKECANNYNRDQYTGFVRVLVVATKEEPTWLLRVRYFANDSSVQVLFDSQDIKRRMKDLLHLVLAPDTRSTFATATVVEVKASLFFTLEGVLIILILFILTLNPVQLARIEILIHD